MKEEKNITLVPIETDEQELTLMENSSNDTSSEILFEDTTKRSENVKHFRMKNGHYMAAVYDKPVHTFDKVTGKFVDIVHRFDEKEECFEAETDRFKARFPKKEGKRKFVTVEKDGRSVSWRYIPATNSHKKHAVAAIHQHERASLMELPRFPQLKYEKTEGQIDLEYGITEQGVKENIVLAKHPKHSTFRFELKLDGLRAVLAEDKKSILLFAEDMETDEPEFIIPPVNMTDAAGVYSEAAYYELVVDENNTVMEIVIDPEWLLAEERLYPVIVDPQIFMYNNGSTNPWTMASVNSINQKTTDSYSLKVGYDQSCAENRVFMKVTLAKPPQGYMITDAILKLAQKTFVSNGSETQYEVRAVNSNWTVNSLSWSAQPQSNSNPVLDTFIGEERDSNKDFIKLNITDQVKQWYDNNQSTGSFVVKVASTESSVNCANYVELYTDKMTGVFSPMLLVTYASADSYADHQKSESFEFGKAGSGAVNLFNGKLTFVHSDVSTQGNPLPLSISHIYRSEFSEDTAANDTYGHGWILSANQKLKLVNQQDVKAVYRDAQGRQHYFIENSDGTITDDAGMELFYEDKCNASDRDYMYRLFDEKGNEMLFDDDGNLFRISDAKQNTCEFTYVNGQLKTIIDGSGRTATLEYTSNRLVSIKDNRNRYYRFTYTGDLLTKISYPCASNTPSSAVETTVFEYDTNKQLIKIIDRAGMQYRIEYTNQKVTSVKQIDDNNNQNFNTNFNYYARSTAVIDGITGLKMVYRYDENGRVRSSYEDITGTTLVKGEMTATTLGEYESLTNTHDSSKTYAGKYCSVSASVTQCADQYCNILRNGFFENNAVSWRMGGHSTNDGCGTKGDSDPYNYYELVHSTTTGGTKYLRQEVTQCTECLNGNVLVASAWACADGHVTNTSGSEASGAKFELKVTLKYEDGTSSSCKEKFDSARSDWQYVALPIALIKGKAIAKIVYTLDFSGNSGTVKFANARLFAVRGNVTEILYNISQPSELNTLKAFAEEAGLEKDIWSRRAIIRSDGRRDTIEFEDNSSDIVISKIPAIDGYTNFTNLYLYDATHRLIKSVDYRNMVTECEYDDFGNVTLKKVHPKNSDNQFVERSEYSANGAHLLKSYTPRSNTVCTEYAYTNDLVSKRTDPNDQEFTYGYNVYNDEMTSVSATVAGNQITNGFTYEHDNLIRVAHNGYNYHFDYDGLGRTTSIRTDEHPASAPLVSMAYTVGAESTVRTTYANGYTSIVTTDARGNPIEKRVGKSANLTMYDVTSTAEYDEMGNPVKLVDKLRDVCYTYKYNRDGNVTMITEKPGNGSEIRTTMAYDEQTGRMTVKSYGATGQRYEMQYEANGSGDVYPDDVVNGITLSGKFTEQVEKDSMNRVQRRLLRLSGSTPAAFSDTYTYWCYDISGNGTDERATTLVEHVDHTVPGGSEGSEDYTYNDSDLITKVTGSQNATYTYDGLNRLIREVNTDANRKYEWTYDDGGNITSKKEYYATTGTLIHTASYGYDPQWKDKLVYFDGNTAFVYDALGNPTTYRGHTLEWTNVRRLKKYDNVQFTYGADGIRTSKTSNNVTTTYTLDGNRILKETDGTKTLTYFYGLNGVVGFRYNSNDYYYVKNVQGDVLAIYNASGTKVASYVYDAWGKNLSVTNHTSANIGTINPFRYRSYYYDVETGLYYLQTRYYDPEVGRFINSDSLEYLGDGTELSNYNLFAYCGDNPVNYFDPNGTDCVCITQRVHIGHICEDEDEDDLFARFGMYAEHSKKGTTNPANKNKHQKGQSRKQRDNRGEKGDARREDRSNKNKNKNKKRKNKTNDISINVEYGLEEKIASSVIILGCVAFIAFLVLDDATGAGAADNVAILPLVGVISDKLAILVG